MKVPSLLSLWLIVVLFGVACQEQPSPPSSEGTKGQQQAHKSEGRLEDDKPGVPRRGGHKKDVSITLAPEALEGQVFETAVVTRQSIRSAIHATANIKPNEYKLIHVSPRIEGKAVTVLAGLGDRVQPGQTLAVLDSIELGQKKSVLRQAHTTLSVTQAHYEREKRLFEQKISSTKDFLDAQGAYQQSAAAYQAAFEALELVGLSHQDVLKIIKKKGEHHPLSSFPLAAPQKGTIIARKISPGELVTPRDKPFTIADLTTVWILLDIYETDLAEVRVGAEVRVTMVAYPDETFHGAVVYLANLVNPDTRTVEARVEIPNPDGRLRPGMFARASIESSVVTKDNVLVVPQEAIQHIDEKPVAFVEEQPGTYVRRTVTLGSADDRNVEIRAGLEEGERVVTIGSFYLKSVLLREAIGEHSH
ncbi:MAG: efflux RND transporter periplasmic adaptor subunit [Nitrospira sp.]|nr:efflux RND transporter periplasmic adaptor subunit [Nitrospira sp.]